MANLLSVHDFRLGNGGPAISFSLKPGQVLAVFGPAGSGKTKFLRSLCGLERGYRGSVRLGTEIAVAGYPDASKRSTPESIARRAAGKSGAGRVAEALAATRLWESRRTPLGSLSPGAQAAAEMLAVLASPAKVLFCDGQIERLDPWTRESVFELVSHRLAGGSGFIASTSLPELAPRSDLLVVWKECGLAYAGTYKELARRHGKTQFAIESLNDRAARALCDPFEVRIHSENGTFKLEAKEGQALAARMLLEGYGDVKAIVERPPTPEEVLASL